MVYSPPNVPLLDQIRLAMQITVSLGAAAASLFVILARRGAPKDKHWAYATVGMALGFWLNSK